MNAAYYALSVLAATAVVLGLAQILISYMVS